LIYPVPDRNWTGIGIHITKDLNGYLKLGPDVEYLPDNIEDYSFNYDRLNLFYEAAKRYIPQLQIEDLTPDQTGIRAKLQKEGEPFRDFIIKEESSQNLPNFINLIGIESPGLTSSLAISRYVKKIIETL
jgi:L-2-hydroxyglutarate oxidase LhgO